MAQGSTFKLETRLVISRELGIAKREALEKAESLAEEVSKILAS